MLKIHPRLPAVVLSTLAIVTLSQGCGDEGASEFGNNVDGGTGPVDSGPLFPGVDSGGDGSSGPCVNLQCQQVQCEGGKKTTISGKVYDPAMANPLYNAIVYVPNAPLEPIKDGATCDKCAGTASGSPIASAITDATGSFVLENVPVGENIPVVIQMGKWRRQVTIPKVNGCVDNPITDKNVFRLPRNQKEGNIPKMAIATGGADPFECLLLKIGIDKEEFTVPSGKGRVHYYVARDGIPLPGAPDATTLWKDAATLKNYDIVLLPCEGAEVKNNKPDTARTALLDYTSAGGRVFATHYSYVWLAKDCDNGACGGVDTFSATANWDVNNFDMANPTTANIVTTFPKGQAFADWLYNVGATDTKGQLVVREARNDLTTEKHPPSQRWVTGKTTDNEDVTLHFTFNTPITAPEDQQCGRVVFSDFHVSTNAIRRDEDFFPETCRGGKMTEQEQALEFMLFDLSSCIQVDDKPPVPPPIIPK